MRTFSTILGLLFIFLTATASTKLNWKLSSIVVPLKNNQVTLRAGYIPEDTTVPFRGNIIYYQGLGDSMMNHDPLFSKLVKQGFRVIAFDYFGQGGSQGSMNSTRISKINEIGHQVFEAYRKKNCEICDQMNIIGWSTGGLAAYRDAYLDGGRKIKKVVLIAPGISPNFVVGEGIISWPPNRISMRTLTTADYIREINPHVDPIKPESPLQVPSFSYDLVRTAQQSKNWPISRNIEGFVLLSDVDEDNYVDAEDTVRVLNRNAHHFSSSIYKGARHEIDNERAEISQKAIADIVNFLTKNP